MKEKDISKNQPETEEAPEIPLTPDEKLKGFTLGFISWLIPGSGHFIIGEQVKAICFFILLNGLFVCGIALHGEIAIPVLDIHSTEFNIVNILIFIFGLGNGLMTCVNLMPFMKFADISQSTYEVGTLFMVVSGSLNVFVILNVWDTYRDRLIPQKTGKSK